jgi:hypothetical protein
MAIKKTKVESPKPRVSAKQRFDAYRDLAVNTLYKALNPSNRRAAAITSHEMVNGILKPNAINITELISMSQTAKALGHYIRLSAEGEGPKAQLIITFVTELPSSFELTKGL